MIPSPRRPLAIAFVVAVVLHFPLTPAFPLFRLLERFAIVREEKDWDYKPETPPPEVPIELVSLPPAAPPPAETTDNSFAPPPDVPKTTPEKSAPKAGVAFAPNSSPERQEDSSEDGASSSESKKKKREKDEGKKAENEKKEREIVGLRGLHDEKLVGKPNVSVAMWFAPIRAHVLGAGVTELFACNPEWKPFLAQGLKPLDDLEGLLVSSPVLSDAARATVAVQHHLDASRVHDAMDLVVRGTRGGEWLDAEAARVVLQRSPRVIFPHPSDMLFVAPESGWKAIAQLKDPLSLPPPNGRAFSLTLQKPSRPLKKLGLRLPERLKELRVDAFANGDGTVDVEMDFEDESEAAAKADAREVEKTLDRLFTDVSALTRAAGSLDLLGTGDADEMKLPEASFDPVETRITGSMRFSARQGARVLSALSQALCPQATKRKPK